MSTELNNESSNNADINLSGKGKRIAIIVAEWNSKITFAMLEGATAILKKHDVAHTDIEIHNVPGAFELTLGAEWAGTQENIDAVICIGCVIKGETPHFEYICQGVTYGITTNTAQQAIDRAGGIHGNKGVEAALTALKMLKLRDQMNVG